MAVVTSDLLAALFTNYRLIYEETFLAAMIEKYYPRIAMEVTSETLNETYNFFGSVPEPQQWTDTRQEQNIYPYNFTIQALDWELTIAVDRNEIQDNRLNMTTPRIQQLGAAFPAFVEKKIVQALVNGAVSGNNSYDGVTFYNASHVIGKAAAQTNLVSYTGATLALVQADFATAKSAMRNLNDDQGRPAGIMADFVLCAPAQEQVFRQLLNASFIPSGSVGSMENTFIGQADLGVSPFVTAATWHLLCTKNPIKPLIYQNRQNPNFVALDKPDSQSAFFNKKFYYGSDARANFGYGEWMCAQKVA